MLEPHSTYAPVVQRIFSDFLAGSGIKAIASALTAEGIPSPSAADPSRNRHRTSSQGAWGQSAIRAILKNPRYTGYQVWARQRKDEVLLDIDDVAAGHVTKQRWNPADQWQWSREPAHPALITRDDWDATQDVFTAGTRRSQPQRQRKHDYMLKGMVTCNDCGRKLVANSVRGRLIYQCRMKTEYPGLEHPKSLSVREDHLLPTIDNWLGELFDPDHIDHTIETLANVETDQIDAAEELAARRTIKDCDKRIANFEIALGTTNDPDTIAGFARQIERTRAERKSAELRLRRLTTGKRTDRRRDPPSRPEPRRRRATPRQCSTPGPAEGLRGRPTRSALRPREPPSPAVGRPVGYEWCRRGDLNPHALAGTSPSS